MLKKKKRKKEREHRWLTPVILATQEADRDQIEV
jgi:hypothetical protein